MSEVQDCPFCNLKERILKQNNSAILFLSNPRKMRGHFLVTPKRHVEKPWELSNEELLDVFKIIFFVQKLVTEKLAAGCDVRQNYRPFLEQSHTKVDHVHYHVMPRDFEDQLYKEVEKSETKLFSELTDIERNELAKIVGYTNSSGI